MTPHPSFSVKYNVTEVKKRFSYDKTKIVIPRYIRSDDDIWDQHKLHCMNVECMLTYEYKKKYQENYEILLNLKNTSTLLYVIVHVNETWMLDGRCHFKAIFTSFA